MRRLLPILLLLAILLPETARAHAILLESQPPARGVAPPGPARITLRFNSRVDHARSRILLRGPSGDAVLPVARDGAEDVLEAPASLQPGDYVLRWQVLAVDGHITRGDVPFQVRPALPPQAQAAPPVTPRPGTAP